jgi:hypothetical protein
VGIAQALDACRQAVCALLVLPPEPDQVTQWLAGPYHEATRFAGKARSIVRRTVPPPEAAAEAADVVDAQRRTARLIEAAGRGGDALVRLLPAVVLIRPAHDGFGGRGVVPFDAPRATLVDRALSLALADYLTRPEDFLAQDYPTSAASLRRLSQQLCAAPARAGVDKG